ncbi:hypothetical protein DFQ00_10714 [Paenibacillus barcinonensis]|uniref:Uncharacterized protein n=1 Tax=Paenibacillus barcinonensis TaxID=198119 RepID=A0A2V4VUP1_PAEBA|nr:hypothetical protein DFQ00_10714 [Paenibacillus barcinonensis]
MHVKTTEVVFFFLNEGFSRGFYFHFSRELTLIYICRRDGLPSFKKAYTKSVMRPPSITWMGDSKEQRRV